MMDVDSWVQTFGGMRPKQRAALACALRSLEATHAALDRRTALGTLRVLAQTVDGPVLLSISSRGWARQLPMPKKHWYFTRRAMPNCT